MQKSAWVTVICSCYNHAKFVSESIGSVLNQSHKNIQLIVIDDFSADDSVAVIEKILLQYPQILFIKNKTNQGITKSFNNAMSFAKGDYILDLSADDVLLPNCIGTQLETFNASKLKDLAIVFGNAELIAENGAHHSYFFDVDANYKTLEKMPIGDIYSTIISTQTIICSVSAMIKKSYFDILNGYDESLSYEDFDFWIRIARHYNIDFVDAVLVKKRIVYTSLHSSFSIPKNTNGLSTYLILRKAYTLNRNKKEHRILSKRVNNEIKFALKTGNFPLAFKNILLRLQIGFKSI